jgi:hypothetical protein
MDVLEIGATTGIVGQVGHLVTNDSEWEQKLQSMTIADASPRTLGVYQ